MTTLEAFADSVDQDQTAQNVQSDLLSTLSTFHSRNLTVSLYLKGSVILANQNARFIYSVVKELSNVRRQILDVEN